MYEVNGLEDTLIGRYCGDATPPPITSEGNILRIKFKTDHSTQMLGFAAMYTTGEWRETAR